MSTRQKNSWNYSNNPLQKFGNPWFLILCEVTWMIHDCSFVLCWLFMSPLFVLNSWTEHCSSDKSSTFCRFCSFPAFAYLNPFSAAAVWFDAIASIQALPDNAGLQPKTIQVRFDNSADAPDRTSNRPSSALRDSAPEVKVALQSAPRFEFERLKCKSSPTYYNGGGLGPRPRRRTHHGLPNPRICHGRPSSQIRPGGILRITVLHQGAHPPLPGGIVTVRDAPSGRGR